VTARKFATILGVTVATAVVLDLWLIWMADAYLHVDTFLAGDFITYWSGARHLLEGAPLFAPEQLAGPYRLPDMDYGSGYVYPPTAAALSAPLAPLAVSVAWAIFVGGAVGLLGWAVYRIARDEGLSPRGAAVAVALVVTSGPVGQGVFAGNVNLWIGVGLAFAWLRSGWSTALAVIGALIKLYPGIGVLWAIRRRTFRWPPILLGAVFGLVVVVVFGLPLWRDFLTTLANARPLGASFPQPPRANLEPFVGPTLAAIGSWLLTAALAVASLAVRSDRFAFFLLSLAMIVPAQEWHAHYYLIPVIGALPGACHLAAAWRSSRGRARAVAASTSA
jgi:hypothetical protein